MSRQERPISQSWDDAGSISDLGWMTVAWLLGDVEHLPSRPERPATETYDLIPSLELMNSLGLVSTASRPGRVDRFGRQRACLEAFGDPLIVEHVAQECTKAGLNVKVRPLKRVSAPPRIIVASSGKSQPRAWGGEPPVARVLQSHFRCRSALGNELDRASAISVIDLNWGRRDLLWYSALEGIRKWVQVDAAEIPRMMSNRGLVRHLAREILESA